MTDRDLEMIVARVVEAVGPVVRTIVKEELANVDTGTGDPPVDSTVLRIVAGPDEHGRVQYGATRSILPNHWFLDPNSIVGMNDKQRGTIRANAGCNDKGKIGPIGPIGPFLDKETNFISPCYECVPGDGEADSWVKSGNVLPNWEHTLANRNKNVHDFLDACRLVAQRLAQG